MNTAKNYHVTKSGPVYTATREDGKDHITSTNVLLVVETVEKNKPKPVITFDDDARVDYYRALPEPQIPAPAPAVKGPAILTTRLNKYGHNQLVLAKSAGYAYTYANRTQAGKKAAALQAAGIACHVTAFYPFYIAIEESK